MKKVCKKNKNVSILSAMIPGAKVDDKDGTITVQSSAIQGTIVFNIGGMKFETSKSILHSVPNSPLADDMLLRRHYRPATGDYFFDRDPDMFKVRNS
jgi:hypothetical protein